MDVTPCRVLKETAEQLATPLSILYQISYDSQSLPNDWGIVYTTPFYKKGSHNNPSNYRPVSLTSVVCTVMESIIRDDLMEHL